LALIRIPLASNSWMMVQRRYLDTDWRTYTSHLWASTPLSRLKTHLTRMTESTMPRWLKKLESRYRYTYSWCVTVPPWCWLGMISDADSAVGLATGQVKTGAPCRSEHLAKYNQASDFLCVVVLQYKTYFCSSIFAMMATVSSPTSSRTGLLLCQVRIFPLPSLVGLICTMFRVWCRICSWLVTLIITMFVHCNFREADVWSGLPVIFYDAYELI